MDSSRVPRPSDRRVINGRLETAAAPRQAEEPAPAPKAEPNTYRAAPTHRATKEKKQRKRLFLSLIILLSVALLGYIGWTVWANASNASLAVDSSKYQAVFFTNGQVYFGKLSAFNKDYLKLNEIYYLQTTAGEESGNLQQTSDDQNNVQLVKLGNEIHGPEDEMIISKDQVLFYENLKTDGNVAKSIAQFKNSN